MRRMLLAAKPYLDLVKSPDKTAQELAERVVSGMLAKDAFSQWLGIEALEIAPRRSTCRLTVRNEMVNGFGVAHGGIAYSLADTALAFACNTRGTINVAIENAISYPAPVNVGDILTAVATMDAETSRLSFYRIVVTNQHDSLVATFRGTTYDTKREHV
jgi:acyl-CoA thioesterase